MVNADASVNATPMLFDLEKQTIPVALASTPIVLLVRGDSPHKSAKDLWAWARPIRASLRCLAGALPVAKLTTRNVRKRPSG